jgi:hypothetical protein
MKAWVVAGRYDQINVALLVFMLTCMRPQKNDFLWIEWPEDEDYLFFQFGLADQHARMLGG